MSAFRFNLNHYILVKLEDRGYEHLAGIHNAYVGKIPTYRKRTGAHYRKAADANGYTKFQAWDFIQKFGDVTGMGFVPYYSTEIILQESDLRAVKQ